MSVGPQTSVCEGVCVVYVTCGALDVSEKDRIDGGNHQGWGFGNALKRGRTRFCAVPLPERCIGLSSAVFMASERPFLGRGVALAAEWRVRTAEARVRSQDENSEPRRLH